MSNQLDRPPLRLQVTTGDRLTAEVIGEWDAMETLSAQLSRAKDDAGQPMGGSMLSRADLPRYWDVPVGARVDGQPDAPSAPQACFCGGALDTDIPATRAALAGLCAVCWWTRLVDA